MFVLSSSVIPIDKALKPAEIDLRQVAHEAKDKPVQLVLELIALAMMVVGIIYSVGPVYAFFKSLGRLLVQTSL